MPNEKRTNYRGVNLKKELMDAIDEFIKKHPEAGYVSTADLVSEAVRLRVQELKGKYPSKS
ncbi:MAG: ribbon-helix-helix domain-containing protein [Candidatus Bathyarchaeota archaeon]|nr:ribbon-helix-helix domain-containing protein [Candidatus Bathyarchaeota archaeon]